MPRSFLIPIFSIFLSACVSISKPESNSEFSNVSAAQSFEGTYANSGDPSGYLSEIIWPGARDEFSDGKGHFISHASITSIQVRLVNNGFLTIGIAGECVRYRKHFVADKDYTIQNGRILLKRETAVLSRGAGDVILGPSSSVVELGLDQQGNGKFRSTESIAGLLFTVIPMAGYAKREVAFKRLPIMDDRKDCPGVTSYQQPNPSFHRTAFGGR